MDKDGEKDMNKDKDIDEEDKEEKAGKEKKPHYYTKHGVSLYNTDEGVQEACNYAPFVLMQSLELAGDHERLWYPDVLIYKGNVSKYLHWMLFDC
jgi:hypothetical protein